MADKDIKIHIQADVANALANINAVSVAIQNLGKQAGATATTVQQVNTTLTNTAKQTKDVTANTVAMGSVLADVYKKALSFGKSVASSFATFGVQTLQLQRTLGGTAEQMSGLLGIANAYGVDFNALIVSFRTFAQQANGNNKAFRDLGLSYRDANGQIKDSITLIKEAADRLNQMSSISDKTAAGGVLFGRRYKDLVPILALGSQGIDDMMKNMQRLGLTMDQDGVNKAVRYTLAQKQLHQSLQGLSMAIAQNVVPTLSTLFQGITNLIVGVKDWAKENENTVKMIAALAGGFVVLYGAIKTAALFMKTFEVISVGFTFLQGLSAGLITLATSFDLASAAASAFAISEAAAELFNPLTAAAALAAGGAIAFLTTKIVSAVSAAKSALNLQIPPIVDPSAGGADSYTPGSGIPGKSKDPKVIAAKKAAAAAKLAAKAASENLRDVTAFWKEQVKTAEKALAEATKDSEKYKNVLESINSMISDASNLPAMFENSFAQYVGPSSMINYFKKRVEDMRKFLADVKILGDNNLDPDLLMQIIGAGPVQGLQMAESIVTDPNMLKDIADLNNLQGEVRSIQAGFGTYTAGLAPYQQSAASYNKLTGLQAAVDTAQAGQEINVTNATNRYNAANDAKTIADNRVTVVVNAQTNASPASIGNALDRALRSRQPLSGSGSGAWDNGVHLPSQPPRNPASDPSNLDYWINSANPERALWHGMEGVAGSVQNAGSAVLNWFGG